MTKTENLNRIKIVLAEPQDSANIGSVCRAMKTMGIKKLCVICNKEYDISRINSLAVHAKDLWENAEKCTDLDSALSSVALSVALTRRKDKFRKLSSWTPKELSEVIKQYPDGEIALVFGRENNGLTDEEVEKCNAVCTIETSDEFPSLNLAQSVQIICYTLFTNISDYNNPPRAVCRDEIEKSTNAALDLLSDMSFFKTSSDERSSYHTFIKDFLSRAALSKSELNRIDKFFKKAHDIAMYKNR